MLFTLLITTLLSVFRPCEGSSSFQKEYRCNYVPETIKTTYGRRVVAPDTPYVAAAGQDQLYFIDTRFDAESAAHIKEQIERANVPKMDEYISIDELAATAEVKNAETGETTFVFNPAYARVLFAGGMNRHNPEIMLPEHEPAGDALVTYDLGGTLAKKMGGDGVECGPMLTSVISSTCCPLCTKAVDTPKKDGETDAEYYQRMDKLHWGGRE